MLSEHCARLSIQPQDLNKRATFQESLSRPASKIVRRADLLAVSSRLSPGHFGTGALGLLLRGEQTLRLLIDAQAVEVGRAPMVLARLVLQSSEAIPELC